MENRTSLTSAERAGYIAAMLLLVSGLVHLAILLATGGSWEGPLSFRKPVTFGLSFGLTLMTIVWVSRFLTLGARARTTLLISFTAASVVETALVSLQTWRGVPSHFNVETAFDAWVTRGLAGAGIALVVMVVAMTAASFRAADGVAPSMRIAVRAGFLALCGAIAAGVVMIARGMTLVAAGAAETAYHTGGFLEPVHAVLMHGILVLPALAWLTARAEWSERQRSRMVMAAVMGYALAAAVVTIGTLAGPPATDKEVMMSQRAAVRSTLAVLAISFASTAAVAQNGTLKGTFVLNGVDARLTNVRAVRTVLDDGKKKAPGYAVLLSAKPGRGDITTWRTGDPKELGSFVFLMLEANGTVWIAELGHAARKGGRFGVVTELAKMMFEVKGDQLIGRYGTHQEETFFDDRYTADLTFDVALEGK